MTFNTSAVAVCCSSASLSSRLRAAFSFCRSLEAFAVFRTPNISCCPRRPYDTDCRAAEGGHAHALRSNEAIRRLIRCPEAERERLSIPKITHVAWPSHKAGRLYHAISLNITPHITQFGDCF